jgi:hypothetical protein
MLHPNTSETYTYVPMPGNPNLLIQAKNGKGKEEMEEEEEPVYKPAIPLVVQNPDVVRFESYLSPLLYRALDTFYTFVGMLEAESGKHLYYRYIADAPLEQKQNPLVTGARDFGEFRVKNAHLGPQILDLLPIHEVKKPKLEPLGAPIAFVEMYRKIVNGQAGQLEIDTAPDYLWSLLPDSVFQFIIGQATWGAILMSARELGYAVKPLIEGDTVSHKFAEFVCKRFLSPKQNGYATGANGGNVEYRISSGFGTSTMATTKYLMGLRLFFGECSLVRNPRQRANVDDARARVELAKNRIRELAPRIPDFSNDTLTLYTAIPDMPERIDNLLLAERQLEIAQTMYDSYSTQVVYHS